MSQPQIDDSGRLRVTMHKSRDIVYPEVRIQRRYLMPLGVGVSDYVDVKRLSDGSVVIRKSADQRTGPRNLLRSKATPKRKRASGARGGARTKRAR